MKYPRKPMAQALAFDRSFVLKAALFLLLAFAITWQAVAQMPPARVQTVTVDKRLLSPQIQVPGTVVSRNDSQISAEVIGRITWVAEVGDTFKKGDVIARIDNRFYRNEVKRLEADSKARSSNLERIQELAESQFSSVSTLEQAVSDKENAEALLDQARHNLGRTEIRAPFDGVVVERSGQLGAFATIGTQILRLVDIDNIEISARVPISSAPYLDGIETVFVSEGNNGVLLPVRSVVPVGDDRSRMMEIRVSSSDAPWVVGSAVKVDVPSGPALEVVAVPRDALILRANSIYLFTVDDEGNAKRVNVRLGAASGQYVEVIGDLPEGAEVVIRGGERLQEGQQVAAVDDNL